MLLEGTNAVGMGAMAGSEEDAKSLLNTMLENNFGSKEGSDSSSKQSLDTKSAEVVGSETFNLLEAPFASPFQASAFSAAYSKALAGVGFDGSAFNPIASEPPTQPEASPVPKLKAEVSLPFLFPPASATLDSPSSPMPLSTLPEAPPLADPPEAPFDTSMTEVDPPRLSPFSTPYTADLSEQMPFVFTALVMLGTAVATLSSMRKTDEKPVGTLSGDVDQVGNLKQIIHLYFSLNGVQ